MDVVSASAETIRSRPFWDSRCEHGVEMIHSDVLLPVNAPPHEWIPPVVTSCPLLNTDDVVCKPQCKDNQMFEVL